MKEIENYKELTLAIDTSTEVLGLGISDGINTIDILSEIYLKSFKKHSKILHKYMDLLLKENQIELSSIKKIAVTIGPGSFTGLRIGLSVARTLGQTLDIPVAGVSTLDVIASQADVLKDKNFRLYCPIINALPGQVYVSVYIPDEHKEELKQIKFSSIKEKIKIYDNFENIVRITDYSIVRIDEFLCDLARLKIDSVVFTGPAVYSYKEIISEVMQSRAIYPSEIYFYPRISNLIMLSLKSKGKNYSRIEPLYINPPNIRSNVR